MDDGKSGKASCGLEESGSRLRTQIMQEEILDAFGQPVGEALRVGKVRRAEVLVHRVDVGGQIRQVGRLRCAHFSSDNPIALDSVFLAIAAARDQVAVTGAENESIVSTIHRKPHLTGTLLPYIEELVRSRLHERLCQHDARGPVQALRGRSL